VTNRTINERIVDDHSKLNIKCFMIDSLENKEVSAIVTDGEAQYDNILKEVAKEFGVKIAHPPTAKGRGHAHSVRGGLIC